MTTPAAPTLIRLTAQIASAHCANNQVAADALPRLIHQIYQALAETDAPKGLLAAKLEPAVPVRRSVFPDYIVCLEDGKKLKMLKRHLRASYGMTPQQYRERWGLPADYPMIAPNYAKRRIALNKEIWSGRTLKKEGADQAADPQEGHEPRRRGRPRKAA